MTDTFRKGGSFVALNWLDGKIPDPDQETFAARLKDHRFRTIDTASSEETSMGWVTPSDPFGEVFDLDAMVAGPGTWLRMRTDTKRLPGAWVRNAIAAHEASIGKRLTGKQRRAFVADLASELLPRVLPATRNDDALLFPARHLVLLFSASKSTRESFSLLFWHTFDLTLLPLDPLRLAQAVCNKKEAALLERVEPTRWRVGKAGVA